MKESKDLVKNTGILTVGKMFTQMLSFFLLPLYTYFLTPDDFGRIDLILSYIALLAPVLVMQIDRSAFRFLIDSRKDNLRQAEIISSSLAIVTPVTLVILLFTTAAAVLLDSITILVAGLACVASILSNQLLQIARGLGRNKLFAMASILSGAVMFISVIIFIVFLSISATGILLAVALSNLVACIYLMLSMQIHRIAKIANVTKSMQINMLRYSWPLVPSGISWWSINAADRTIISAILGLAANGIYAVANRYSAVLTVIYGIFEMSWTESASLHIYSERRHVFFSQVANASLKVFSALGLLAISGFGLLFPILVDDKFSDAYHYFPIMVVAALSNCIAGTYSAIYIARKMTKQVLYTSLAAAALSVTLSILLMPSIGLYAAALSSIAAFSLMTVFRHIQTSKYVTITYEKRLGIYIPTIYALVVTLYSFRSLTTGVLSIVCALLSSYMLNRSLVNISTKKMLAMMPWEKVRS